MLTRTLYPSLSHLREQASTVRPSHLLSSPLVLIWTMTFSRSVEPFFCQELFTLSASFTESMVSSIERLGTAVKRKREGSRLCFPHTARGDMQQTFDLVEGEVFQEKKMTVKSYDWPRRQAPEFAGYEVRGQTSPPSHQPKLIRETRRHHNQAA